MEGANELGKRQEKSADKIRWRPLFLELSTFSILKSLEPLSFRARRPRTMPPTPFRIAILEADSPIGHTLAKYGSYRGVFTSLLHKAADASHIPRESIEITGWDVVNGDAGEEYEEEEGEGADWKRRKGYPRMGDVDGVLITGSRMFVTPASYWFDHLLRIEIVLDSPRIC